MMPHSDKNFRNAMASVNEFTVGVLLILFIREGNAARDTDSDPSSRDFQNISSCLEVLFSNNGFQFFFGESSSKCCLSGINIRRNCLLLLKGSFAPLVFTTGYFTFIYDFCKQ